VDPSDAKSLLDGPLGDHDARRPSSGYLSGEERSISSERQDNPMHLGFMFDCSHFGFWVADSRCHPGRFGAPSL
jgi:hypothetical protein